MGYMGTFLFALVSIQYSIQDQLKWIYAFAYIHTLHTYMHTYIHTFNLTDLALYSITCSRFGIMFCFVTSSIRKCKNITQVSNTHLSVYVKLRLLTRDEPDLLGPCVNSWITGKKTSFWVSYYIWQNIDVYRKKQGSKCRALR